MDDAAPTIMTIGHSTLSYEEFLSMLRGAGVSAVADVRSVPYSRHTPQFNSETLKAGLKSDGIAYVFLGDELGGRPETREFYCEGVADYELMATKPTFEHGLGRVIEGATRHRIAMMCSEQDPLDCHRCLLVGRALKGHGFPIKHILNNGLLIKHDDIEQCLLAQSGEDLGQSDFLFTQSERLANAYRARARKVAFADSSMVHIPATAAG